MIAHGLSVGLFEGYPFGVRKVYVGYARGVRKVSVGCPWDVRWTPATMEGTNFG